MDDFMKNSGTSAAFGFAGSLSELAGLGDFGGLFGSMVDTMSVSFVFTGDGKYTMRMNSSLGMWLGEDLSESESGTYTFDGKKLTMDGEEIEFSLKGETLTIYQDAMRLKMT